MKTAERNTRRKPVKPKRSTNNPKPGNRTKKRSRTAKAHRPASKMFVGRTHAKGSDELASRLILNCPFCNNQLSTSWEYHFFQECSQAKNFIFRSLSRVPNNKDVLVPEVKEPHITYVTDDSGIVMTDEYWRKTHPPQEVIQVAFPGRRRFPRFPAEMKPSSRRRMSAHPLKMAKCPKCSVPVSQKRLAKHLLKVHHEGVSPKPEAIIANTTITKKQTRQQPRELRHKHGHQAHKGANVKVQKTRLNSKAEKYTAVGVVKCTVCGQRIKQSKLKTHLSRVHSQSAIPSQNYQHADAERTLNSFTQLKEAFLQSNDEPRDGSKYLGHMRREWDGKFGSFPLHDDYEDSSDAD